MKLLKTFNITQAQPIFGNNNLIFSFDILIEL